jgi:16S rRNA C1402 (ribose-2'-O) methylase RsmI
MSFNNLNALATAERIAEDKKYQNLIMREYEIKVNVLEVRRHNNKATNKEMYEQLVNDEKDILELQELLSDKSAKDIVFLFDDPHAAVLANQFIKRLYLINPISFVREDTMKRCREILNILKKKYEC